MNLDFPPRRHVYLQSHPTPKSKTVCCPGLDAEPTLVPEPRKAKLEAFDLCGTPAPQEMQLQGHRFSGDGIVLAPIRTWWFD